MYDEKTKNWIYKGRKDTGPQTAALYQMFGVAFSTTDDVVLDEVLGIPREGSSPALMDSAPVNVSHSSSSGSPQYYAQHSYPMQSGGFTVPQMPTQNTAGGSPVMTNFQAPPGLQNQASSGSGAPQETTSQAWQGNPFFTGPMALDSQLTGWSKGGDSTAADQSSSPYRVGGVTLSGTCGDGVTMSSVQEELVEPYPEDPDGVDRPSTTLQEATNSEEVLVAFDETTGAVSQLMRGILRSMVAPGVTIPGSASVQTLEPRVVGQPTTGAQFNMQGLSCQGVHPDGGTYNVGTTMRKPSLTGSTGMCTNGGSQHLSCHSMPGGWSGMLQQANPWEPNNVHGTRQSSSSTSQPTSQLMTRTDGVTGQQKTLLPSLTSGESHCPTDTTSSGTVSQHLPFLQGGVVPALMHGVPRNTWGITGMIGAQPQRGIQGYQQQCRPEGCHGVAPVADQCGTVFQRFQSRISVCDTGMRMRDALMRVGGLAFCAGHVSPDSVSQKVLERVTILARDCLAAEAANRASLPQYSPAVAESLSNQQAPVNNMDGRSGDSDV